MLYVALLRKKCTSQESFPRRVEWEYPEGVKLVGEYWLTTNDPHVVIVVEADDVFPIMMAITQWEDLFDITYYPAMTAEDGITKFSEAMG